MEVAIFSSIIQSATIENMMGLYKIKRKTLKYLIYTNTHVHDKEGINQMKRHAAKITYS